MTRVPCGNLTIRVWREVSWNVFDVCHRDIIKSVSGLASTVIRDKKELAAMILEMPLVNAVEVLDSEGNGEVLYKDWP